MYKGRKFQSNFSGGGITPDSGVVLLRQTDKIINLTNRITATAADPRDQNRINYSIGEMLRQRVYRLALGYEGSGQEEMNSLESDLNEFENVTEFKSTRPKRKT
jgi:hypothetical protein